MRVNIKPMTERPEPPAPMPTEKRSCDISYEEFTRLQKEVAEIKCALMESAKWDGVWIDMDKLQDEIKMHVNSVLKDRAGKIKSVMVKVSCWTEKV